MNINWYPGHMKKTKELISENTKLVDVVVELIDARIPFSGRNPEIDTLIGKKHKLIVYNKMDLADAEELGKRIEENVLLLNSLNYSNLNIVYKKLIHMLKYDFEKEKQKGMKERPIKIMVVGIPNVGKSTFINGLIQKKIANVGNKPGVTRGKQWIRIHEKIELLDTPGILWPKIDDEEIAKKIALVGSINEDLLDMIDLAIYLIHQVKIKQKYLSLFEERYKIQNICEKEGLKIIEEIGTTRGYKLKNNVVDIDRTCRMIYDEFKNGKIGRINLD